MTSLFTIPGYRHDPRRRKHRFRCASCAKLIADDERVVGERRGKSSHAYHGECWDRNGINVQAAKLRSLQGGRFANPE